jgi:uncharacterized protein
LSLFARVSSRFPLRRTLLALALALSPLIARAQPQAPPPPSNFFTDTAGIVPSDAAARIEQRLQEFEKESSNQLLVVVGDRMPEGYTSIEEYANRTAQAWKVGNKARDNGAVLFVFTGDRKIRLEVGYGLEGALPDALASRIINDEIAPQFREGRYGDGLLAGVEAIIRATRGEYQPMASRRSSSDTMFVVLVVVLFLLVGVVFPIIREVMAIKRGYRTYTGRGTSIGRRGSTWGSGGGFGGWSGGGGSSWGGGGGGGFSGGGGSFGGGGASGSW